MTLDGISTPALVLDRGIMTRNARSMSDKMKAHGVNLRPHCKTPKSTEVAHFMTDGHSGGITVSTLREANYFAEHGYTDITLAVTIDAQKLPFVDGIQENGATLGIITDSETNARDIVNFRGAYNTPFAVYIEIDTGYGRSGITPDDDALLTTARVLHEAPNVNLRGVLTHAGHSYKCQGEEAIAEVAEQERSRIVAAAERIRAEGIPCPVVSVGSTPTMQFARSLEGVTEARPGCYIFYDLSMVGRGVCTTDDIAASVLTTVIACHEDRGHVLVDAGALALSKDISANTFMPGIGYGLVVLPDGSAPWGEVVVHDVCQEQGWLAMRDPSQKLPAEHFPIGTKLRILPNHTCMTCAAYWTYLVHENGKVVDVWHRVNGW